MAKQVRKYSRPHSKKMVVVNTEAGIQAMDQFVNRTMSSLYALDVILFYIADELVAEKANEQVRELLEEKLSHFNSEVKKLKKMVEESEVEMPEYTQNHSTEYKIYSPLCSVFIKLIHKFELNTQLIDALWLDGEIPSSVRKKKTIKLARHLRNISRQIVNISKNAMVIARQQGKEKEIDSALKELQQRPSNELLNEASNATEDTKASEKSTEDDKDDTQKIVA